MALLDLIGSQPGRAARLALGLALIGYGAGGRGKRRIALLGVVPAAAGALDACVLGPVVGRPFNGARFRDSRRR